MSVVLLNTDVLAQEVVTVSAYSPSLEGRINTLPSRHLLSNKPAASSLEHSTNQLQHIARCLHRIVVVNSRKVICFTAVFSFFLTTRRANILPDGGATLRQKYIRGRPFPKLYRVTKCEIWLRFSITNTLEADLVSK